MQYENDHAEINGDMHASKGDVSLAVFDHLIKQTADISCTFLSYLRSQEIAAEESEALKEAQTHLVLGEKLRSARIWLDLSRAAASGQASWTHALNYAPILIGIGTWPISPPRSPVCRKFIRQITTVHGRVIAMQLAMQRRLEYIGVIDANV